MKKKIKAQTRKMKLSMYGIM